MSIQNAAEFYMLFILYLYVFVCLIFSDIYKVHSDFFISFFFSIKENAEAIKINIT